MYQYFMLVSKTPLARMSNRYKYTCRPIPNTMSDGININTTGYTCIPNTMSDGINNMAERDKLICFGSD